MSICLCSESRRNKFGRNVANDRGYQQIGDMGWKEITI